MQNMHMSGVWEQDLADWAELYVLPGTSALKYLPDFTIDISWVDWSYKSSTCDVMYCRQRRHLYYGGQI
jgi:hypothetical protein